VKGTAHLSECELYRYTLDRVWGDQPDNRLVWLMLNPSTADAEKDDPTIRRCIAFSCGFGYDALRVVNLFALRATNPMDLVDSLESGVALNDCAADTLLHDATSGEGVVVAWGAHGGRWPGRDRVREVLGFLRPASLSCLGRTKDGHPKHPLYVKGNSPLTEWSPAIRAVGAIP